MQHPCCPLPCSGGAGTGALGAAVMLPGGAVCGEGEVGAVPGGCCALRTPARAPAQAPSAVPPPLLQQRMMRKVQR